MTRRFTLYAYQEHGVHGNKNQRDYGLLSAYFYCSPLVTCCESCMAQSCAHTAYPCPAHKDKKMVATNTTLAQCIQEYPMFYEDEVDIR